MSTEGRNDPNPNHCGICFEPYGSDSPTVAAANSRRASQTCRHAICLECAIQYVFASNQTNCPFCRSSKAYSSAEFRALLDEANTTDTASIVVTPHVRELLETAMTKLALQVYAEHENDMQAFLHALYDSFYGERFPIPRNAIFEVRMLVNQEGNRSWTMTVRMPIESDRVAAD